MWENKVVPRRKERSGEAVGLYVYLGFDASVWKSRFIPQTLSASPPLPHCSRGSSSQRARSLRRRDSGSTILAWLKFRIPLEFRGNPYPLPLFLCNSFGKERKRGWGLGLGNSVQWKYSHKWTVLRWKESLSALLRWCSGLRNSWDIKHHREGMTPRRSESRPCSSVRIARGRILCRFGTRLVARSWLVASTLAGQGSFSREIAVTNPIGLFPGARRPNRNREKPSRGQRSSQRGTQILTLTPGGAASPLLVIGCSCIIVPSPWVLNLRWRFTPNQRAYQITRQIGRVSDDCRFSNIWWKEKENEEKYLTIFFSFGRVATVCYR